MKRGRLEMRQGPLGLCHYLDGKPVQDGDLLELRTPERDRSGEIRSLAALTSLDWIPGHYELDRATGRAQFSIPATPKLYAPAVIGLPDDAILRWPKAAAGKLGARRPAAKRKTAGADDKAAGAGPAAPDRKTLLLPVSLLEELREAASRSGLSTTALAESALRAEIERRREAPAGTPGPGPTRKRQRLRR